MPLKNHFRRSVPATPKKRDSQESTRSVAPGSPSVTSHKSNRSVDTPKTTTSGSVSNKNSVKLVPGSDEKNANIGIPMPAGLTYFTDKNESIDAQASNISINDNFSNSTMPHSDHSGLPLRSAPNGAQKSYSMGASASMYGSSPGQNGSYSNAGRLPLPNNLSSPAPISTVRALSGQFGGARSHNNLRDANATASDAASTISEWSSAVGGASNSGKSGRVIEKLMAERDTLKRENALLKQEKTDWLAERSMAEEKVARQLNEAEMELHEAQGNKLLLKKRDRQVGELKDKVEKERDRADEAVEHERTWKRKLEELQDSSKQTIVRLQEQLAMESNSNAMLSRNWKDDKEKINAVRTKLQKDVKAHLQTIVAHADTNNQRDQVQQESQKQIDELNRVNKKQASVFNDYKAKIDQDLEHIKADADARVAEAERLVKEVMETADKMKWVMNVKKNVRDAR